MTTMLIRERAVTHSPRGMAVLLLVLWIGVLMGIIEVIARPLPKIDAELSEHAVLQHGQDANQAKHCLDGERGFLFWNPGSRRWAVACWLGDRWGIVILTAAWTVITAFVTTKLPGTEKMKRYMKRQGYLEK